MNLQNVLQEIWTLVDGEGRWLRQTWRSNLADSFLIIPNQVGVILIHLE